MSNFWKTLKKPIIGLSPMDGVTDFPMREIQTEIAKPDVIYTEFISIEGFLRKPKVFLPKLKFSPKQRPIVAQLFGSNPLSFNKVIPEIVKLGFDGVDINMGCPVKNIMEQGGGGALIGNFPLVEKIITTSLSILNNLSNPIPLSLKTRITADEKDTLKWLKFLSQFSISAICVHARPLKQLHSGPVSYSQLAQCSQLVQSRGIVFLGNGGIKNKQEGLDVSQEYHLDGVLIGQSAIGNPWVFSNEPLNNPCHSEHIHSVQCKLREESNLSHQLLFQTLLHHSHLAWDFYGEKGFINIRKHLSAYCKNFPGAKDLRQQLITVKNLQDLEKILSQKFSLLNIS